MSQNISMTRVNRYLTDAEIENILFEKDDINYYGGDEFNEENHPSSDSEVSDICEVEESDCDESDYTNNNFFIGKDKVTKWRKSNPPTKCKTRNWNIISRLPGPKGAIKSAKSVLDVFLHFITIDILNMIVTYTNQYIAKIRSQFSNESDCLETNVSEIKALLAVLLMAGLYRACHLNYEDLWATDGNGNEFVRMCMCAKMFLFLLRCIRFDSLDSRENRINIDKMTHIRDLFDTFVANCKKNYSPGEYLTIDEMLVSFRGNCSFKVYIPSKPAKYGLKIYSLVDSKTFYTLNLEVYVGSQPEGPYRKSNSPSDIVKRLIEPVKDSKRNLTFDNWYTSIPLVEEFKKNYSLTAVGTLRKNKREIPTEFLPNKKRAPETSVFGYRNQMTLVSYVPKKMKSVILLSSMHEDGEIDENSATKKPEIISFYNLTKGGVDTVDEMCSTYSCGRKTRRWPLALFFSIVDIAALNACIIYNYGKPEKSKLKRRLFLKNLAFQLAEEHIKIRSKKTTIPSRALKRKLIEFSEENNPLPSTSVTASAIGRCYVCPRAKDRKSRKNCTRCKRNICSEHTVQVCEECFEKFV